MKTYPCTEIGTWGVPHEALIIQSGDKFWYGVCLNGDKFITSPFVPDPDPATSHFVWETRNKDLVAKNSAIIETTFYDKNNGEPRTFFHRICMEPDSAAAIEKDAHFPAFEKCESRNRRQDEQQPE